MNTLRVVLLTFLLVSFAKAADWRFGSMSIRWFDGFERTPNSNFERFVGPKGEIVRVTAMGLRDGGDMEKTWKSYIAFGESELPRLNAKQGKDIMKLQREELPDGITLFSTAATAKGVRNVYYLQFFAVSQLGRSALITIEGRGDAATEWKRYRPLFDSISWRADDKRANKAPEPTP